MAYVNVLTQYMSSVKYTHMFVDDYVDGGPILPLFAGIIMIHEQGIPFSTLQYSRVIEGFFVYCLSVDEGYPAQLDDQRMNSVNSFSTGSACDAHFSCVFQQVSTRTKHVSLFKTIATSTVWKLSSHWHAVHLKFHELPTNGLQFLGYAPICR